MKGELEPTKDVKIGVISSDEHLLNIYKGQVFTEVKEQTTLDSLADDKDIRRFLDDGGKFIVPGDDDDLEYRIELDNGMYSLRQIPYGDDDAFVEISVPSGMSNRKQLFEDALIAVVDRFSSENVRTGALATLFKNMSNHDYLTGLDRLVNEIKQDRILSTNLLFSKSGEDGTDEDDPIKELEAHLQ